MSQLFVGLISGTSADAIDCALVNFHDADFELIEAHSHPFPEAVRLSVLALSSPGLDEINRCGQLDRQLGFLFAEGPQSLGPAAVFRA